MLLSIHSLFHITLNSKLNYCNNNKTVFEFLIGNRLIENLRSESFFVRIFVPSNSNLRRVH